MSMQKHNDHITDLLRKLRGITLSDTKRAHMRASLAEYADFHTPKAAPPQAFSVTWLSFSSWGMRAGAAFLAVLILAGGTAYASDDALPGTPLYTVKVNIKEPLEVALATTPAEKAEKHAELAERRLEEVAKLAVVEKLDVKTQTYLEQEFGEHVDSSLAAATELEATGEAEASLEVRSDLEARLVAHEDILDLVEDRLQETGEEDRPAHQGTRNILRAIELRKEVVKETRIALEQSLEEKATQTVTLALVTEAAGSVSAEAKAALLPTVIEHVEETDSALTEAKQSLERSDPNELRNAFRKAHEAERSSEVVNTLLKHADILLQVDRPSIPEATSTPEAATTTPEATTTPPVEETPAPRRYWWSR